MIWFTNDITAWAITKEMLDLLYQLDITITPGRVPGRLNCKADAEDPWRPVMDRITEEGGPLQQDPFGFRGDPTAIFETLEWKQSRKLLAPPPRRLGATIELLKSIAGKPPQDPPSAWEAMVAISSRDASSLSRLGKNPIKGTHLMERGEWELAQLHCFFDATSSILAAKTIEKYQTILKAFLFGRLKVIDRRQALKITSIPIYLNFLHVNQDEIFRQLGIY